MKKLSFVLSFLLLFSLFIQPNNSYAKSQSKAEKAYVKVVNNVKNKYGVYKGQKDESYGKKGLMYVKLIDFDKNKTPELYMVYGTSNKPDENGYLTGFTEEVWTYKNSKATRVYKEVHEEFGLAGDLERSIINSKGKYYLLSINRNRGEYITPYKFNGTKFVQELSIGRSDYETGKMEYTSWTNDAIKYKKISKSKFNSYYKEYNVSKRNIIIDSSAGMKSMHQLKTST